MNWKLLGKATMSACRGAFQILAFVVVAGGVVGVWVVFCDSHFRDPLTQLSVLLAPFVPIGLAVGIAQRYAYLKSKNYHEEEGADGELEYGNLHCIRTRRSGDDGAHADCSCGYTVNASGEARWDVVRREVGRHLSEVLELSGNNHENLIVEAANGTE